MKSLLKLHIKFIQIAQRHILWTFWGVLGTITKLSSFYQNLFMSISFLNHIQCELFSLLTFDSNWSTSPSFITFEFRKVHEIPASSCRVNIFPFKPFTSYLAWPPISFDVLAHLCHFQIGPKMMTKWKIWVSCQFYHGLTKIFEMCLQIV